MKLRSSEQLLEELALAAGNMLSRVRVGGGARDQLHSAYLDAANYFRFKKVLAAANNPGIRPPPDDPRETPEVAHAPHPEFAPPDAMPAHERVIAREEGAANVRQIGGRLVRDPSEGGGSQ
jgi:hypothetical protein